MFYVIVGYKDSNLFSDSGWLPFEKIKRVAQKTEVSYVVIVW